MSAAALQKFLDGSTPTPPVYRKLRAWEDQRQAAEPDEDGESTAAGVPSMGPADPRTTQQGELHRK